MSYEHTPPNHRGSPINKSTDEEHRSINKRYRFWKHPSRDKPEVVRGECSLGRTPKEVKDTKKEAPGKAILGYRFTLSESQEYPEDDNSGRWQISESPEPKEGT